MNQQFSLLVPVKTLARAKTRLEAPDGGARERLMRAFALDAIAAATQCSAVARVYVVTDEPGFDGRATTRLEDRGEGDLNLALTQAAREVRLLDPTTAVAAMCADLPCLHAEDLADALAAGMTPRWFVSDAAGTGTTLLAAGPGIDLAPHFGVESATRHESSGATPVRAEVPTLRQDVDTEADLSAARALGVGSHTLQALAEAPTS